MSLINWVYSITTDTCRWILRMTGMYTKKVNILVIGLDNAGKTTLLGMLSHGIIQCHEPTSHSNNEIVIVKNIKFM